MTPELIALHGFDPYADTGSLWGSIKSVGKSIGKAAKGAVHAIKTVSKIPIVARALQAAETGLKNSGPWGMAANAALQAMGAGLQGKSLEEVAWAAAEGGTPTGIDRAISAAHAIRRGDNVIAVALSETQKQFIPGSAASMGFDVAHRILKGQSVSKAALGTARRALPSEEARRAFDTAVGGERYDPNACIDHPKPSRSAHQSARAVSGARRSAASCDSPGSPVGAARDRKQSSPCGSVRGQCRASAQYGSRDGSARHALAALGSVLRAALE
jgi:hypothetical protein